MIDFSLPEALTGTTSASLLESLKRPGDSAAWSRFVKKYAPLLYHWCKAEGLQHADAMDLTQESLVGFWRTAPSFRYDPNQRFRGYLRMLFYKTLSDWNQREERQSARVGDTNIREALRKIEVSEEVFTRLERIFDQELLARAMAIVRKHIQPQTWQAFELLAVKGLSGKEAAEHLGMKVGTVVAARCEVQEKIRLTLVRIERAREVRDGRS